MSNYEFWDEIGNIFNAVVAYQEKSIEFNNRFINPWIRLGNVFDKQDHNTEAVKAYKKVIELDPQNAQNWYELGNIYFKIESYADASEAYSKAIELASDSGWSYNNLALTLAKQGKYVDAIPLYKKTIDLLEDHKDKAVAWNRLGDAYRKINEYELAVDAFQKADELDQENANIHAESNDVADDPTPAEVGIGEVASESDSTPDTLPVEINPSINDLDSVSESQSEILAILLSAAENNSVDSQFSVDNATGENPSITDGEEETVATTSLSTVQLRADAEDGVEIEIDASESNVQSDQPINQNKEAEAATEAVATSDPALNENIPSVHAAYNEFLKDSGEDITPLISDSLEMTDKAQSMIISESPLTKTDSADENKISDDTKNATAWNERGNAYFNTGSYDDSIVAYGKAIELDRQFAWPYSNLALVYVQKGRFAEAILFYKRSIELFSSDADKAISWNRLGNAYRKLDDYDNATKAYQEADRLDPHNTALSHQSRFSLLGNSYIDSKSSFAT